MDWERTEPFEELAPSLEEAGPGTGEDIPCLGGNVDFSTSPVGRRPPGRRISHRKNPSDTFAFAAGQLFQTTPEDFYNLLEGPLDSYSGPQGLQHAISADRVPLSPQIPLGSPLQQGGSTALGFTAEQRRNLELQVPNASHLAPSGIATPPVAAAAATASLTAAPNGENQNAASPDPAAAAVSASGEAAGEPAEAAAAAEATIDFDDQQMPEDDDEDYDDDEQRQHSKSHRKQQTASQTRANALDPSTLDPRRAKRILANRQSAQRSRMKRLQYIHDLENRSAATSATLKELLAEVQQLQEQQAGLAETVEARKAQVDSLSKQLLQEQTLRANLWSHIAALKARAPQQQQQQPWPPQQQQHQQPWPQAGQHQQLPVRIKQEPQQQQQQQLQDHQQRPGVQEGYSPHYPGNARQPLQQQQQQCLTPAYTPSVSQPPVSQLHAMDLGHPGAGVPALHKQHIPQQQQQQPLLHHHQCQQPPVLQGVPVQLSSQQHLQQEGQQHSTPGSSSMVLPHTLDPAAVGLPAIACQELASPAATAAAAAQQLQQQSFHKMPAAGAAAPAAVPVTKPVALSYSHTSTAPPVALQRTPSPSKPLGVQFTDSPLNLGLAPSLGGALPEVSEGDIAGLLQEQTYLTGGLSGTLSGGLGMGSGGLGMGSGGLRLTPSIELPSAPGDGLAHGGMGSSGLGPGGYLVRPGDVMGAAAAPGDVAVRKTLSM